MLRCKSLVYLFFAFLTSLIIVACGDDSDRAKAPVTDYGNLADLSLATLSFDVGSLSPEFDANYVGPYSLTVDSDVSSVQITAVPAAAGDVILEISKKEQQVDDDGNLKFDENGNPIFTIVGEANLIEEGEVDTKTLRSGENVVVLRVSPREGNTLLTYIVNVHRVNTDGKLLVMGFVPLDQPTRQQEDEDGNMRTVTNWGELSPKFSSSHKNYTASAAYESCTISMYVGTNERHNELTIAGERAQHAQYFPLDLDLGENVIDIVSTPESGDGVESYELRVTRATPTAEQLLVDATLKDMVVTGGQLSQDFICYGDTYFARSNNSVENIQLAVTPSVDGAALVFGTPSTDDDNNFVLDDPIPMLPGEPISIPLNVGVIQRAVEVTATDGVTKKYYALYLERGLTNWVEVETGEELQAALKNAEPNDEIRLAPTFFEGTASLDASGNESAHFFSSRSGTAEQPIVIKSQGSAFTPVLLGESYADKAVLMLSGDYWQVENIQLVGARNGLILDAANHNVFDGLRVTGVGERGVHIRNGSSSNVVRRSVISNTGLEPREGFESYSEALVVGSIADDWSSAPGGSFDEADLDNRVQNNIFGPNIVAEAIDIREGSLRTNVQYNIFDSKGISNVAENGSVIVVKGNDANISYNTFINESGADIQQLITAKNVERDWLTSAWGENASFYQNIADLGGSEVPLANSYDVSVFNVAENVRKDNIEVSYLGAGINNSFTVPLYQLQTVVTETLCVAEERPVPDVVVEMRYARVTMAECSSSATEQRWKLVNSEGGFVYLVPADDLIRALAPAAPAYNTERSVNVTTFDTIEDLGRFPILNAVDGYFLSWQPIDSGDYIIFVNKGDWGKRYVLSADSVADELVKLALNLGSELQRFRLVAQ